MNVAPAADRGRIPQMFGDAMDGADDVSPCLRRRIGWIKLAQCQRGEHSAAPGAKIFRRKILAGDRPQVGIHVSRSHTLHSAGLVEVLKQILARESLASFHNTREARMGDVDEVAMSALSREMKANGRAGHADMPILEGRQAVGTVRMRVNPIPDPHCTDLEQADQNSQHAFTAQPRLPKISADLSTNRWQCATEGDHAIVLGPIALGSPTRMIPILFASTGVASRGLQMAIGVRGDPDLAPCGRNHNRTDANQRLSVPHYMIVSVNVSKASSCLHPANAWHVVAHMAKAGGCG